MMWKWRKRTAVTGSQTQDISDFSCKCFATEQQPGDHKTSQFCICTADIVLNASVAHLAATQHVLSELH